jgi:hypothetical protein
VRRLLAVIGAVGMVAAAFAVRAALDDDAEGGPDTADDRVLVVCDADLRVACDALGEDVEVRMEDAAVTSAAFVAGDLDEVDGWVTTAAWRELTDSRTERSLGEATVLASSRVVLAVDADRAGAVRSLCEGAAVWRCVGDNAEQDWEGLGGDPRWGPLRTGLPDADTATGLSVLASVAAGYFDGTDFAANDFGDLRAWLSRLADPSSPGDRSLLRTLVRVRGTYTAGGLLEAAAGDRPELEVLEAAPPVDATVVLVDLPGGDTVPGTDRAREALVAAGWDTGDGEPASLLKPGVMAALHNLWKDITS